MATKITTRVLADDAVTDAKIADVTLTTATQAASDNTTKIATTAYVTTAIANLADSAPSTLNTLNELAAALGDDASFSTTVTNSIAAKLPLAGGTLTGDIQAPGVYIGSTNTSYDLYNNGSSYLNGSVIVDDNLTVAGTITGPHIISTSNTATQFKNATDTDIQHKLETNAGADFAIHRLIGSDGVDNKFIIGYGPNHGSTPNHMALKNVHASGSIGFNTGASSTERMRIDSNGKVGLGDDNPATQLHVKNTGGIELRLEADSNNNGQEDCFVRFYTDGKTQEGIAGMDNNNGSTLFSSNTENAMVFGTVSNLPTLFATNNTERMQIDASGRVLMGIQSSTTPEEGGTNAGLEVVGESSGRFNALRLSNKYTVSTGNASTGILFGAHTNGARDNALIEVQNTQNGGDAIELQFHVRDNANNMRKCQVINWQGNIHSQPDSANVQHYYGNQGGFMGGNSSHNIRAAGTLFMLNAGGGSSQIVLEINGANRGSVSSSSSSGVFSDRDMKENIQDIEIGLSEVLQLRPRRFKYKTGAHETYGFIAQEVETTVPLAVDEIELPEADVEANKTTLKTLDTTSLIAALVKSIQELEARIATLEG